MQRFTGFIWMSAGTLAITGILLMLLSLALLVAGGLVLWSVASRAPRGYEDGTGFHLVTTLSGEVTVPGIEI